MLNKNNFFNGYSFNKKKYSKNLKKTKEVFQSLIFDLKNGNIPLLQSYDKDYSFDFSLSTIKKFSKHQSIVVIGMGGSILGLKSIYSFFKDNIKKKIFFFDNLDENLHLKFDKIKKLKNSCFIIISKSGNTLETITNFGIVFSKIARKNKFIFITEAKDSNLINMANTLDAEIIEHKDFIGGRYSVMSEAGMFPAALMGLSVRKFKNLKKLLRNKNFVSSLIKNVASIYTLNNQGVKNSVVLNYNSNLNDLSYWYQQLVCESLGKNGKGITTIISSAPKDHHSVFQLYLDGPRDKFFTFFNIINSNSKYKISSSIIPKNIKFLKGKSLTSIINAQFRATKNIFKLQKIPSRFFVFKNNNEEELGKIITFFVLETILLARLMNVNPFNQPSVEQIKIETKKILLR